MPGYFSKDNLPSRPGTYFRFESEQAAAVPPSVGLAVALGITHDWGPFEAVHEVASLAEFRALYGRSEDTPGYRAARMAFQGEGVAGAGGAGTLLVYRMGGASAAKATRTLSNTTPAVAITLTAKYEGSKGNDLRATVQDTAGDAASTDLILLDGTQEVERYTFLDADIQDLVDQINAESAWVTAALAVDGVALAPVSAVAFAGGDDGSTLLSADYTSAMTAFEVQRFSVLAFENLTDGPILASLKTWAVDLNSKGKRFITVVGGAAAETAATAITRSGTLNDENFVNVGVGTYEDETLIDAGTGDPFQLSTAMLAPRIAGIIARRGEGSSLTFARLANLVIVAGPTEADIDAAFKGGVTVLARDSNVEAPVRIEKGITTYTVKSDDDKPYLIFRNPKFVRTMGGIQTDLQEWADANVVGRLPVNGKTRDFVLGETKGRLAAREAAGVIQSGWTAFIDPDSTDDDEFVSIVIGLRFGRSAEQVFFTASVG